MSVGIDTKLEATFNLFLVLKEIIETLSKPLYLVSPNSRRDIGGLLA